MLYSISSLVFLSLRKHYFSFCTGGPPKPKDDWGSNPGQGSNSNWGDPMGSRGGPPGGGNQRDPDLNSHVRNDRGGWGGPQGGPQGGPRNGPQGGSWGAPPPGSNGPRGAPGGGAWDHESPNMNRRMDDPSGTYHWGRGDKVPPGPPGSGTFMDLSVPHPSCEKLSAEVNIPTNEGPVMLKCPKNCGFFLLGRWIGGTP